MEQNRKTLISGEINELMETIQEQIGTLNSYKGRVPVLEFDILKDNIRRLYEMLGQMQKENDLPGVIIKSKPEKSEESVDPEIPNIENKEPLAIATETPSESVTEQEKKVEVLKDPEKPDLFASEESAFKEKLIEAREQTLGPRSGQSRPADIKSLININDKFMFINDLFDGDYKEYTHAIEIFSNFNEKGEAFGFLDSLLKDNLWNSASPAFLKLKEIVEKRFI